MAELLHIAVQPSRVRNICVIAHVDHGKTSLSDCLIAANGIISRKLAGKVRYLDSREDEQQRCITMKSSAISILHAKTTTSDEGTSSENYVINLIDSPGHVDFCSEVSSAVRLSDGALVLVDVVEGVRIQTLAVLRQAWDEHVQPCLILNKMDRLITELNLTPLEAYHHINRIIQQVNATAATFHTEYLMDIASNEEHLSNLDEAAAFAQAKGIYRELYEFSPELGNVAFASAMDGWAFRIEQFAAFYAQKLKMNQSALKKALWGQYFFNSKTGSVTKDEGQMSKSPMFVQMILTSLWDLYDAVLKNPDAAKVEKIVASLKLTVPPKELTTKDRRVVIQSIASRWLPLHVCVLDMVVDALPPPSNANRVSLLLPSPPLPLPPQLQTIITTQQDAIRASDPANPLVLAFVSKMFTPGERELEDMKRRKLLGSDHPNDAFVAFARVFSGTLKRGDIIHVLGPRYDPAHAQDSIHRSTATITSLFLMMGREMTAVDIVPAGSVCAIGGLGHHVLKYATLASSIMAFPLPFMTFQAAPIVRVAVEPTNPNENSQLVEGLRLLNKADPCVLTLVQETGEHVVVASGEVHLERCLKDLQELFAKIQIKVSAPIVPLKETLKQPGDNDKPHFKYVDAITPNHQCTLRVAAIPLPKNILKFLSDHEVQLAKAIDANTSSLDDVLHRLGREFESAGVFWQKQWPKLWALGPNFSGRNLLINHLQGFEQRGSWVGGVVGAKNENDDDEAAAIIKEVQGESNPQPAAAAAAQQQQVVPSLSQVEVVISELSVGDSCSEFEEVDIARVRQIEHSIVSGFQIASKAGPMCEEPMEGVAFILQSCSFHPSEHADIYGPFSGQVMSAMKEACRRAFMTGEMRIVEPMFLCEVQASTEVLGSTYSVLNKRRGRITSEELREGTDVFTIQAMLPVVESFGFATDLRTKTSGAAAPQLMFSHWETLDIDPFFVPTTEEDKEEFGDIDYSVNIAKNYINEVRRRKGLAVEEKIVEHAEKQRTRARKK